MAPYKGWNGTDTERFERKFIPEPNSGCWLWLGGLVNKRYGYGSFRINDRSDCAHRASWMLYRGPIPALLEIDHKCRNPYCVNPEHLRVVTKEINLSHRRKQRERCGRGHLLSGDNIPTRGVRHCKTCRAASRLRCSRAKQ